MSISALTSATTGMVRASNQLQHSANRIAQIGVPGADVDIGIELSNVLVAKNEFKANVKVASVTQSMTKSLIDILA